MTSNSRRSSAWRDCRDMSPHTTYIQFPRITFDGHQSPFIFQSQNPPAHLPSQAFLPLLSPGLSPSPQLLRVLQAPGSTCRPAVQGRRTEGAQPLFLLESGSPSFSMHLFFATIRLPVVYNQGHFVPPIWQYLVIPCL